MSRSMPEKLIFCVLAIALVYPLARLLLPITFPFLLALGLALAAEPAVGWMHRQLKLRRGIAAGIGVTGVFLLAATVLTILLSVLVRQLSNLTQLLPTMADAIRQGSQLVQQWMLSMAERTPEGIRQTVIGIVERLFQGDSGFLQRTLVKLPQMAGNALGSLSNGLVWIITAVLAAFMISARLPRLRQQLTAHIPEKWRTHFFPAAKSFRKTLGRWFVAQGKLAAVTLALLAAGFLILRIPHAFLWASLVTMVDILPILGVGTVLVPWSLVSYLQGNGTKAMGLLGIFLVAWLMRSVLEPKLIGSELGLDPLVTLLCIYGGFRLWGLAGMLLAPIVAICLVQLWRIRQDPESASLA